MWATGWAGWRRFGAPARCAARHIRCGHSGLLPAAVPSTLQTTPARPAQARHTAPWGAIPVARAPTGGRIHGVPRTAGDGGVRRLIPAGCLYVGEACRRRSSSASSTTSRACTVKRCGLSRWLHAQYDHSVPSTACPEPASVRGKSSTWTNCERETGHAAPVRVALPWLAPGGLGFRRRPKPPDTQFGEGQARHVGIDRAVPRCDQAGSSEQVQGQAAKRRHRGHRGHQAEGYAHPSCHGVGCPNGRMRDARQGSVTADDCAVNVQGPSRARRTYFLRKASVDVAPK